MKSLLKRLACVFASILGISTAVVLGAAAYSDGSHGDGRSIALLCAMVIFIASMLCFAFSLIAFLDQLERMNALTKRVMEFSFTVVLTGFCIVLLYGTNTRPNEGDDAVMFLAVITLFLVNVGCTILTFIRMLLQIPIWRGRRT